MRNFEQNIPKIKSSELCATRNQRRWINCNLKLRNLNKFCNNPSKLKNNWQRSYKDKEPKLINSSNKLCKKLIKYSQIKINSDKIFKILKTDIKIA